MFKEKVLSLGGAIVIMLICILATYFITNSVINSGEQLILPTMPPIQTQKPTQFNDNDLFMYACIDSYDVQKDEIKELPIINTPTTMIAFSDKGTVLCYSLDEIKSKKPTDKRMLLGLLGLAPDTEITSVNVFTASNEHIFRPAFSTDCSISNMSSAQQDLTNDQKDFILSLMYDAYNKKIAYTRLGYTYNYLGDSVYGVAQYATNIDLATDKKSMSLDEFLNKL